MSGAKIATRQPRNDAEHEYHDLEGDPEHQLGDGEHQPVLRVPLHFPVFLLDHQRNERQEPQLRQDDHHIAIARGSTAPGRTIGHWSSATESTGSAAPCHHLRTVDNPSIRHGFAVARRSPVRTRDSGVKLKVSSQTAAGLHPQGTSVEDPTDRWVIAIAHNEGEFDLMHTPPK